MSMIQYTNCSLLNFIVECNNSGMLGFMSINTRVESNIKDVFDFKKELKAALTEWFDTKSGKNFQKKVLGNKPFKLINISALARWKTFDKYLKEHGISMVYVTRFEITEMRDGLLGKFNDNL